MENEPGTASTRGLQSIAIIVHTVFKVENLRRGSFKQREKIDSDGVYLAKFRVSKFARDLFEWTL